MRPRRTPLGHGQLGRWRPSAVNPPGCLRAGRGGFPGELGEPRGHLEIHVENRGSIDASRSFPVAVTAIFMINNSFSHEGCTVYVSKYYEHIPQEAQETFAAG